MRCPPVKVNLRFAQYVPAGRESQQGANHAIMHYRASDYEIAGEFLEEGLPLVLDLTWTPIRGRRSCRNRRWLAFLSSDGPADP
jgi:hypothetical protein